MARPIRPGSIAHARAMRASRAKTVRSLREGRVSLRELLNDPPDNLVGIDIWDLLLATPRLGPETIRRVCERADLWPHLKIHKLTRTQRRRLIDELPGRIL